MKERDFSLDIIRVLACIMVVFMHSPMPTENASGPFLMALSYFTAPCIGLFFMVSGALLMPIKSDYFTFIRRRLSKIVVPTLVWTLVYIALNIYFSESEINILQTILSIPLSAQGHGVLWFMYTLTGLYLLAPILSAWLGKATPKEIEFVLLLWCVTLCYPLLENILMTTQGTTGILYYFTGYAGYFLLGYYLKHYSGRLPFAIPMTISVIGIVVLLMLKYLSLEFDFYRLFWYESIFVASMCCVLWKVLVAMKFPAIIKIMVIVTSNLSFGIYLVHILIMRYWLWHISWITDISNYISQTLIVSISTLMISTVCCLLISKIPNSQWILGYSTKRE